MEKEIEKKDTFSFYISLVFNIFAISDSEITLSRQKKKRVSLFCARLFVNLHST